MAGGVEREVGEAVFLWPISFQSRAPKDANVVLKAKSSQILFMGKILFVAVD